MNDYLIIRVLIKIVCKSAKQLADIVVSTIIIMTSPKANERAEFSGKGFAISRWEDLVIVFTYTEEIYIFRYQKFLRKCPTGVINIFVKNEHIW